MHVVERSALEPPGRRVKDPQVGPLAESRDQDLVDPRLTVQRRREDADDQDVLSFGHRFLASSTHSHHHRELLKR
jgi:hypothetical protein